VGSAHTRKLFEKSLTKNLIKTAHSRGFGKIVLTKNRALFAIFTKVFD